MRKIGKLISHNKRNKKEIENERKNNKKEENNKQE